MDLSVDGHLMRQAITLEEEKWTIKRPKIMIATPMYGGMCTGGLLT